MPKIKSPGRVDFNRAKKVAYVTYSLGNVDGKYKRVYHTITDVATKAEAREKAEEWRREYNAGTAFSGRTVAEYSKSWLSERVELAQVKNSTLERDGREVRKICAALGEMELQAVTPEDVRKLHLAMKRNGDSQAVMNKTHACLKRIMERAVDDELISKNPARKVAAPKMPKTTREPLSVDEAARFMRLMLAEPKSGYVAACVVAVATGCRRGEVLALTWDDCSDGIVTFARQYTQLDGTHGLKNGGEPRKVSVGKSTAAWLKAWRDEQYRALGYAPESVCTNESGNQVRPDLLRRWWTRWCVHHGFAVWRDDEGNEIRYDDDGWPVDSEGRKFSRMNKKPSLHYDGLKFHELRHTQATILIAAGVDVKTVQARGGWASPKVPMEIYAHAVRDKDGEAADVFERAVLGE